MESEYVRQQVREAAERYFSSPEAEENILRRMLKRPDTAEDIADRLTGKDFSDVDFGRLFCAIKDCVQRGVQIDFMGVDAAFTRLFPKRSEKLRERLVELVEHKPYTLSDAQDISDVVTLVADLSRRRALMAQIEALSAQLRDPEIDVGQTLGRIQEAAVSADGDDVVWTSIADVNMNTYEYLEKRQEGKIRAVPTGITALDRMIGGLFGGEMTIVAARPAVGKSAFGLNIALAAARDGFKVGFVSCEMSDVGFGQRTLSRGGWVNGSKLRQANIDPEDWDKLAYAMTEMTETPIWFVFQASNRGRMDIESIARSVRRKARRREIDLLVVDYIGIMRTRMQFKEERLRIAYISAELKRLAQDANIPVVALCQVNRDAHGQMPTMAQLRDSGAIEQDADGVIFLHRPMDHEDKSIHPDDMASFYDMTGRGNVYISISVAKQRNGGVGGCNVLFHPETMSYTQLLRKEDVPEAAQAKEEK